jgi:hypothetical protein
LNSLEKITQQIEILFARKKEIMTLRVEKDPKSGSNEKSSKITSRNPKDKLSPCGYGSGNIDSCNECDEKIKNERVSENHPATMMNKKVSLCHNTKSDERNPAKGTNTVFASSASKNKRKTREPSTHSNEEMTNPNPTLQQQQGLVASLPASQNRRKRELRVTVKNQCNTSTGGLKLDTPLKNLEETGRKKRSKTCGDDSVGGSVSLNSPTTAPTLASSEINRRKLPPRSSRGTSNIKMQKITSTTYLVPEGGGGKGSANDVIAEDGNHFFCHVCSLTGDVICCDGCPKVYHVHCLPEGKSKDTIDKDPWFCPDCFVDTISKNKHNHITSRSLPTRGLKRKKNEVQQPFIKDKSSVVAKSKRRATTWASMASFPGKLGSKPSLAPSARQLNAKQGKNGNSDFAEITTDVAKDKNSEKSTAAEKKRQKQRTEKRRYCRSRERKSNYSIKKSQTECQKKEAKCSDANKKCPVEATPVFFFFLKENLKTLERKAIQKDPSFKAFPHGFDRNRVLATLGAKKWSKLSWDQRLDYRKKSMNEFMERLQQWRNRCVSPDVYNNKDEALPESSYCGPTNHHEDENSNSYSESGDGQRNVKPKLKRSKDFFSLAVPNTIEKPSQLDDVGANTVLLDLLHDIRFHPVPMLAAKDYQCRYLSVERYSDLSNSCNTNTQQKQSLLQFESQGPISTFIGDVCLGESILVYFFLFFALSILVTYLSFLQHVGNGDERLLKRLVPLLSRFKKAISSCRAS